MKLVELTTDHYHQFPDEYEKTGDNRYMNFIPEKKYCKFLEKLEINKKEETCPDYLVPGYSFWLEDEKEGLLGGIRFRTKLNDRLLIEGGHIGYDIRPSARNRGLATAMVSLLFEKIKGQEIKKVLITCFDDNPASEKVILKHGGKLESIEMSPHNGKMSKRFWVDIPR